MPGLCGIVRSAPAAGPADGILAEMLNRQGHYPWYKTDSYSNGVAGVEFGRVSLGFVNTAAQPVFSEDGAWLTMMDGEIFGAEEERRRLTQQDHIFKSSSQAEIILHGFEQEGERFFTHLSGSFTALLWNANERRLLLVSDRFGMKPLYYLHLLGQFLFASEIKSLLAIPHVRKEINKKGLAQFFTFGQFLGEDTLLENIYLLPAAGCLTYEAATDSLRLGRYWQLNFQRLSQSTAKEATLDRIDAAFSNAVKCRVEGKEKLGISLSGGLDSRSILALVPADRELTSVCLGMEGSMDHDCASEMARLTNRRHHQYFLNTQFLAHFEDHLRNMVHLTDGHYLCQCIVMPTLPLYRELGIEVLLRGHAGELMHMHKAYNFSLDRASFQLKSDLDVEEWLYRRLRTYMLDSVGGALFHPAFQHDLDELARESLTACLAESRGMDPLIHRVWHAFITQRLRRETAMSMVEFGSVVETRLPFLDNELIEALFCCSTELKLGEMIQTHILRKHMPAFLNVPNANTGCRLDAGPIERFMARIRQKVFAKLGVKGYQPYERLGLWLRRELRPVVEKILLGSQCLDRRIFDPDAVHKVVTQHMNHQRNHTFLLMAMMIFEVGQQEFFGDVTSNTSTPPSSLERRPSSPLPV